MAAAVAATVGAFMIRFDGSVPWTYFLIYLKLLPFLIPVRVVIYYACGLYRPMWSHASVPELLRIGYAATADVAVLAALVFMAPPAGFPRSVLVITWLLTGTFLAGLRLVLRLRREWHTMRRTAQNCPSEKTLIFGAGDAGALLGKELAKHPELGHDLVGFIDDDQAKRGYQIAGKPVLGGRADIPAVVQTHAVKQLIIAMPSAQSSDIRQVLELGHSLALTVKTLPGLWELVDGKVSVSQLREVRIEDLLGREEIKVDLGSIAAYLGGETVLITGAGGSIGAELCRQAARFGPRQVVLLGHGENSLYDIDLELRQTYPGLDVQAVIADVQDEARIRAVFERFRPSVVFHAAAHKHVPLMEQNPGEAVKNNVLGTLHVAQAADQYRAKRFVLISTDKAVNPTSVMGLTKRAAEYIVQSLAGRSKTVFVGVRFGNVLGSRGSVVLLFQKQIAAGGPVTVTDPRMLRYFMTIPEAVQLVIQAAAMGQGGEIFVLDMGKPVRIVDLARDLIRLSGLEPEEDIEIVYTGIRPGEKLFEELLTAEEGTVATQHQRIYRARGEGLPTSALQEMLQHLHETIQAGEVDNGTLRRLLEDLVAQKKAMPTVAEVSD